MLMSPVKVLWMAAVAAVAVSGCQSFGGASFESPVGCREKARAIRIENRLDTLDRISDAFDYRCYDVVVEFAPRAREEYGHKTYSIVRESASIFLPEGTVTEYVLESYERGYLTFLLAASYYKLGRLEASKVELRKLSHEKIHAIGRFPAVDWDIRFTDSTTGYFSIRPDETFPADCASATGIRVSTASWFSKIALRHDHGYHPLLNVRSWIRLPLGIAYGITAFVSGASVAIGGCVLDVYGQGSGTLCEVSLRGGAAMIAESPNVTRQALSPDLRHWENVPAAFLFTTADGPLGEACSIPSSAGKIQYPIF
jgi:hypothetical protein